MQLFGYSMENSFGEVQRYCRENFHRKEWLEYKQKQIELEKNAERENGCSEIISKYDGYIN